MPRWLEAMDARPLTEEREDCGFIYYGRHFRSADGSHPAPMTGLLQAYGSVSTLTLPADNGTWGLGVITSARDSALRGLKDTEAWTRTVRGIPLAAHWLDGEPVDDGIAVMAKIEDRHRDMVVDGTPVATGVVLVADSWACTNPSVGRGASIGLLHAVALRDLLRADDGSDPVALAKDWETLTAERVEPWYRSTLSFDRHRLAESEAIMEGRTYETDDPEWQITQAMIAGAGTDPDVLRAFLRLAGVLDLPDVVLAQDGLFEKLVEIGANPPEPPPGPSREELLALVGG
jgi:2-polyprenyl-6-methoxyphenol hydroxylase-like FAD-dependent oxidoreductase